MTITHAFVSSKPDIVSDASDGKVTPSRWNDGHTLTTPIINILNETSTSGFTYQFRKSRGTSSAPTTVNNSDVLGRFDFEGYVGSTNQYKIGGRLEYVVSSISDSGSGTLNTFLSIFLQNSGGVFSESLRISHGTITGPAGTSMTFSGGAIAGGVAPSFSFTATSGTGSINGGGVSFLAGGAVSANAGDFNFNGATPDTSGTGTNFNFNAGNGAGTNDGGYAIWVLGNSGSDSNGGYYAALAGTAAGTGKQAGYFQWIAASGSGGAANGYHQFDVQDGGLTGLKIEGDGRCWGAALHDNAGAVTGTTNQYIASGTYTPTRSSETNLDANVTPTQAQWIRVGNVVTVSGRFTADPTTPATPTNFELSLPIASNLSAADDLAGVAFCGSIAGQGAEVIGVAANDTAEIRWVAGDVTSQTWSYTFTYEVK